MLDIVFQMIYKYKSNRRNFIKNLKRNFEKSAVINYSFRKEVCINEKKNCCYTAYDKSPDICTACRYSYIGSGN